MAFAFLISVIEFEIDLIFDLHPVYPRGIVYIVCLWLERNVWGHFCPTPHLCFNRFLGRYVLFFSLFHSQYIVWIIDITHKLMQLLFSNCNACGTLLAGFFGLHHQNFLLKFMEINSWNDVFAYVSYAVQNYDLILIINGKLIILWCTPFFLNLILKFPFNMYFVNLMLFSKIHLLVFAVLLMLSLQVFFSGLRGIFTSALLFLGLSSLGHFYVVQFDLNFIENIFHVSHNTPMCYRYPDVVCFLAGHLGPGDSGWKVSSRRHAGGKSCAPQIGGTPPCTNSRLIPRR